MKVVHIVIGLTNGGAEAMLYQMCSNDDYCEHTVISLTDQGKYISMLRDIGVKVHCLNIKNKKLSGLFRLYSLLRNIKPDVVQTWMYHADLIGGVIAKIAGVKKIYWGIHSTTLDSKECKNLIRLRKINAIFSNFIPSSIICCAQKSLEVHAQVGFNKDKLVVVHNGYNLSLFKINKDMRNEIRKELSLESERLLIGLVGRFNPQKDHKNLLQALPIVKNKYPSIMCLFVGPDMNVSNPILMEWIDSFDLRENILLLDQRNDVPAIMNALDIHVLPSAFGEAFPNVLNEAMACGIPCVTTDIGDASVIVGDTGWIVPAKDPKRLAEAIMEAFSEMKGLPHDWNFRKDRARNRVEMNFSVNAMILGYRKVWQK